MSKIKLAGKSISEILKRIKRAQRNKRATKNQEKAGLSVKSVKPWNYRAGARDEQIIPVKKQSQKGSSFQPHRVRGKQGEASIKGTSEGSAASWRDEMDKYFGDLRPSKFFKKASGGDINTGMKKLSPKQKAIAAKAPPPDKIDAKDFAVLKAEKAKGRGMGLQDEKAKPGKVMKARDGKAIKKDPTKPVNPFQKKPKTTSKLPGRIGTALGIGAMMVPAAYAAAKQYKDYKSAKNRDKAKVKKYSKGGGADTGRRTYSSMEEMRAAKGFKPGETASQFNKRRMMLEGAKKAAKATKIGKIAAGIGAVGVAASQFLKKKMEEKKENKKMVGGMAKKYSKGGDLRLDYIDRQTRLNEKATGKKNYIAESKKTRREEYGAAKDRYPNKSDKLRGIAKNVGRALTPSFAAAKSVYDKLSKSSAEKYSKGGGADTGKMGEIKSQFAVASDRVRRTKRDGDRLTQRDIDFINKQKQRTRKSPERTPGPRGSIPERLSRQDIVFTTDKSFLKDMKPPSGAAPGKFKSGTMVKARGCKLGRSKPTKMY